MKRVVKGRGRRGRGRERGEGKGGGGRKGGGGEGVWGDGRSGERRGGREEGREGKSLGQLHSSIRIGEPSYVVATISLMALILLLHIALQYNYT